MVIRRLLLPLAFLAGCGGASAAAWNVDDTRKTTEITRAAEHQEELCADDGGPCAPSHVRALADFIRCKASSMLYTHRQSVPDDAGGGCK